jgi:hypothetical protein
VAAWRGGGEAVLGQRVIVKGSGQLLIHDITKAPKATKALKLDIMQTAKQMLKTVPHARDVVLAPIFGLSMYTISLLLEAV